MKEVLGDEDLERQIESFALVPSDGGRFEFSVNGELLFSKKQLGRHAEQGEIIGILRKRLAEA
jgi:selenoprotein W-related protein